MEYFSPPLPPEAEEDEKKKKEILSTEDITENEVNSSFHELMRELLSSPEGDDDDEEEEDDEENPKKKKRKSFLDFFRRNKVARRSLEEESTKEPAPNFAKDIPSILGIETDEDSTEEKKGSSEERQSAEKTSAEDTEPDQEAERVPIDNSENVEIPPTEPATPEEDGDEDIPNQPPLTPRNLDAVSPPRPPEGSTNEEAPISGSSETVVNNVTNIENHPNNVAPALVGSLIVDQLSRHRDRKIRKEAEALKERVEKKDKQHTVAEQEIRKKQQQVKESVERLREAREKGVDSHKERTEEQKQSVRTETRQEPANQEKAHIEQDYETEKREGHRSERHKPLASEIEPAQPEKAKDKGAELVFEQVAAAAEHDIAIESQYERRHEIKDEPTRAMHTTTRNNAQTSQHKPTDIAIDLDDIQHSLRQRQVDSFTKARNVASKQQLKKAALMGILTGVVVISIIIAMTLFN